MDSMKKRNKLLILRCMVKILSPDMLLGGGIVFAKQTFMIQDIYLYIMINQGSLQGIDTGYRDFVHHECYRNSR